MPAERFNKSAAAAYLRVSERTLDLWRAQDRAPRSHKIGVVRTCQPLGLLCYPNEVSRLPNQGARGKIK
jgi:hypothetical protein